MTTKTQLVEDHYSQNTDTEWQRLEKHRTEFAVTLRTLESFLPSPPCSVLDIGGGPGRYAIELAARGYTVTLVDLAAGCLEFAQQKAADAGVQLHDAVQANAMNLDAFGDDGYDAVLLLGPLYHLLTRSERQRAVQEAVRVLKAGGCLFAAFVTRFAPFRYAAKAEPLLVVNDPQYVRQLLETGVHDQGTGFPQAYFAHPDEITPLMERCGLRTLLKVGVEGVVSGVEEAVNELHGEAWQAWVELNYRFGQEPSLYGASEHLLYVGEKPV
ncbi:MAG: class I SAM-dependent methyltransferase [Anaerolineae bacterium]|nr:class I SAM-dependent methyltransferase [Anaerolineae bacterium]